MKGNNTKVQTMKNEGLKEQMLFEMNTKDHF